MSLGFGIKSVKKSKKKHRASIKAKLAAIDQALEQADADKGDAGHAKAEQGRAG
jgi:hypothetical protein